MATHSTLDDRPGEGMQMRQRKETPSLFLMRPISTVTDFADMWAADDSGSEFEEDEEDSPRDSFDSGMDRSQSTVTSYAIHTPAAEHRDALGVHIRRHESISTHGPAGPDLFFRTSFDPANDIVFQMSPVLPKEPGLSIDDIATPLPEPANLPDFTATTHVADWDSQHVAAWMHAAGFEESVIARFEENDIDGEVLLALNFEDLKELGIASFGKRHQIWTELGQLHKDATLSPTPTAFEDAGAPCTPAPRDLHSTTRRGRRNRSQASDLVTPADSVSIVAIEQLIPKPHKCSRGARCPKWRKQQRMLHQLDSEYGLTISPAGGGGQIFMAGYPGNPDTAERVVDSVYRPTSEAMPSVIASSDLLGPGSMPEIVPLGVESLNSLAKRDPQENVKHFLAFQHLQPTVPDDAPPSPLTETPRYEMFPPLSSPIQQPPPLENLRSLPKLAIPNGRRTAPQQQQQYSRRASMSPVSVPHRFGTPASEMDVPISTLELGTLEREASQSVPPNMQFRAPVHRRPSSRGAPAWRRPSMQLPTVRENVQEAAPGANAADYGDATTQSGWMKKRRAKLLRHEWNPHHFRLQGTQLAMHKTDLASDLRALDSIDVDQYSVACSSLVTDSKLAAAMKSLRIATGRKAAAVDDAAFAFSLVPATTDKGKMMSLLRDGAKAHHFMVATRDQRIDWMRSVMLAKAVRQKEQGCDVVINGQKL